MNLHTKIEQALLADIQNGELKIGDQIPTEAELSKKFGVSRPTVRQALSALTSYGYLNRTKGKGTFITEPKLLHESTSMISSYRRESEQKGLTVITKVLALEKIAPPIKIAERLKLKKGQKAVKLVRLRRLDKYNDGKPVVLTTVYLSYDAVPWITEVDFTKCSLYDKLDEYNLSVVKASRELEVLPPDAETAKLLNIGAFEPVISVAAMGFTADGRPVEYSESLYPAGCSKFHISFNI